MQITESKLNKEIRNKLIKLINDGKIKSGLTERWLDYLNDNTKIILIEDNGNLLSYCMYSNIDKEFIKDQYTVGMELEDNYDDILNYIDNMNDDTLQLHYMDSFVQNKGYGTIIMKKLLELNQNMILQSMDDAESYWIKHNFKNIFSNVYLYETT